MEGKILSYLHSFGKKVLFLLLRFLVVTCFCVYVWSHLHTHKMYFQVVIRFFKKVPANEIAHLVKYGLKM